MHHGQYNSIIEKLDGGEMVNFNRTAYYMRTQKGYKNHWNLPSLAYYVKTASIHCNAYNAESDTFGLSSWDGKRNKNTFFHVNS